MIYLRYEFNTESTIEKVKAPILVMHSLNDDVVPYGLGLKVFTAANKPKYSYELHGSHNDGFIESMPMYKEVIKTFLDGE